MPNVAKIGLKSNLDSARGIYRLDTHLHFPRQGIVSERLFIRVYQIFWAKTCFTNMEKIFYFKTKKIKKNYIQERRHFKFYIVLTRVKNEERN